MREIFLFLFVVEVDMNVNTIINKCIDSFAKPNQASKELARAEIGDGLKAIILGGLILGIIKALAIYMGSAFVVGGTKMLPLIGGPLGELTTMLGGAAALGTIIITPVGMIISWLVFSLIIWIVSKIVGGRGDYVKFAAAWAFPMAAVIATSWIPVINVLVSLYSLYLLYVFIQPTMKLKSDKAVLTVILTIIAFWLIAIVLGFSALALVL